MSRMSDAFEAWKQFNRERFISAKESKGDFTGYVESGPQPDKVVPIPEKLKRLRGEAPSDWTARIKKLADEGDIDAKAEWYHIRGITTGMVNNGYDGFTGLNPDGSPRTKEWTPEMESCEEKKRDTLGE